MRVIAIFIRPGVSVLATNKGQKIKWQGLTIPLPHNLCYESDNTEDALKAHQYSVQRYTLLKGREPKNPEIIERF